MALLALVLAAFAPCHFANAQSPEAKTEEADAISQINTHLVELKTISDKVQKSLQNDDALLEARIDRKSTRLNSSHSTLSRMPSSA